MSAAPLMPPGERFSFCLACVVCFGHAALCRGRLPERSPSTPNATGEGAADAVTVVSWISPGKYQLDVQNTSGVGYIDQFTWVPPANLTISAVTSSEGGKVHARLAAVIQCNGRWPAACTCQPAGTRPSTSPPRARANVRQRI